MDKKLVFGLLVLLIGLMSVPVHAQTTQQHIIIIVKENRTPDNLFAGNSTLAGAGAAVQASAQCNGSSTTLQPYAYLDACFNPNHDHGPAAGHAGGFEGAYDTGTIPPSWDDGCLVPVSFPGSCTYTGSAVAANYTYIDDSPTHPSILAPYNQIAEQYGFANYMFQTNQGPSYIAHQFLFSGTSAPTAYSGTDYDWFAVENAVGNTTHSAGCAAPSGTTVYDLWSGHTGMSWPTESNDYSPTGLSAQDGFPCYSHPSMANLLDNRPLLLGGAVSWKYYIQNSNYDNSIWTAPNSLIAICPYDPSGSCSSTEWSDHLVDTTGQVLNDINNPCQRTPGGPSCSDTTCTYNSSTNPNALPDVSWVIPDGAWSDHPGSIGSDGGPSWVAAIVNAIGAQSSGYPNDCGYWGGVNNTTIFITWDDWGGWYDHVAPYLPVTGLPNNGYPHSPGTTNDGKWYVYGFRVPLLVVSAYVNGNCIGSPCTGYISGNTSLGGSPYPGEVQPYIHDFGSILGYVENTFTLSPYDGGTSCGIAGSDSTNYPSGCDYPFADYLAPDGHYQCLQTGAWNCASYPYPLSDFFGSSARTFTTIGGAKYPSSCFTSAANAESLACFGSNFPSDPDDEDN